MAVAVAAFPTFSDIQFGNLCCNCIQCGCLRKLEIVPGFHFYSTEINFKRQSSLQSLV